jgi:hypothetical protein
MKPCFKSRRDFVCKLSFTVLIPPWETAPFCSL